MAGPKGDEVDRVHKRVAIDADISIALDDSVKIALEGIEQLAGIFAENISEGGLFIRTDFPLPIGTRLRVRDLEAIDGTPVVDVKPVLGPVGER